MEIALVSQSMSTDRLLKLANKYCEAYKKELSEDDYREVYFRLADFLKFVEANVLQDARVMIAEYEKLKLTPHEKATASTAVSEKK